MPTKSFNRTVACSPFENKTVEASVKSGFATMKQKQTLTAHRVLFGNSDIPSGAIVYVHAAQAAHAWAKNIFEKDGAQFIFVPQDQVLLVETE